MGFTSAFAQPDPPVNIVLSDIEKIDSLIDVSLLGTLAGLSLASASLLLSGRGQLERQRSDEDIRLVNEKSLEVRKKLEENIRNLDVKRKYVQDGIQYLVKAFFLFIASLVSLLLFFDSFYDKDSFPIQNDLVIIIFEVLPFLVGLAFLVLGAEHIRRTYAK